MQWSHCNVYALYDSNMSNCSGKSWTTKTIMIGMKLLHFFWIVFCSGLSSRTKFLLQIQKLPPVTYEDKLIWQYDQTRTHGTSVVFNQDLSEQLHLKCSITQQLCECVCVHESAAMFRYGCSTRCKSEARRSMFSAKCAQHLVVTTDSKCSSYSIFLTFK